MHRACAAFVACSGITSSSPAPTRTLAQAEPSEGRVRVPPRRISDFSVGEAVEGRVAFRKDSGAVFVDIGSFGNALLVAPNRLRSKLKPNEILNDLSVEEADANAKRLVVKFQNPEKALEEREEEPVSGDEVPLANQAKKRPLSDFSVGDVVDGQVAAKVSGLGVYLDVGAVTPALLIAPYKMARKLYPKEMLRNLRVKEVDLERRCLAVTLPGEEAWIREGKTAETEGQKERRRHIHDNTSRVSSGRPLADFCVGDVVDGRVVLKQGGVGVLLDVGAAQKARLDAPNKVGKRLRFNQILRGLSVTEVDLEKRRFAVSLPFTSMRRPLSDFSVNDTVDGRVAFKMVGVGAFVQIGAVKSALLLAPYELAMKLKLNETLLGLRVEKVEPTKGSILVTFPDLEAWVRERNTAAASGEAINSAPSTNDGPPQADPKPLTDFSVDDVVDGRVAFKKAGVGVFVDIGAARLALLIGPYPLAMRLRPNSTLQGLILQKVDLDRGRLAVTFPPGLEARYKQISDFCVGDVIDGEVAFRKGGVGVFVDVGAVKNAPLVAPTALALKLKPKESLKGLRVEKVDPERNLLAVTYPNLERHVKKRR